MKPPIKSKKKGNPRVREKKEQNASGVFLSFSSGYKFSFWSEYFLEIIQPCPAIQDLQAGGYLIRHFN